MRKGGGDTTLRGMPNNGQGWRWPGGVGREGGFTRGEAGGDCGQRKRTVYYDVIKIRLNVATVEETQFETAIWRRGQGRR